MSVIAIPLPYIIIINYKIPKRPDQNIRFYFYLAFFSLLLFIFLTMFSLLVFISLSGSLSLSPLSLLSRRGHLPLVGHGDILCLIFLSMAMEVLSLSPLSLSICQVDVLICTVLIFFNHCC